MKYIFIINSFTVKDKINDLIHNIRNYCETKKYNYEIEINNVDNSTEAIVKKYKKEKNILIAIGGDGMLNRILNCIVNTDNILSLIPYGTGNDFYKSALKDFKEKYNNCDLVKINDRYFINTACFGIDAYAANNKKIMKSKHISKKQKYNISAIDAFFKYKPVEAQIKINDQLITGKFTTIAVCNGQYYGGGYNINPNSNLNNDLIDVYIAEEMNRISMAKLMISMKNSAHLNSKKVKVFKTNKLTIKFSKPVNSNIDGEELESKIFKIEVLNKKQKIYFDREMIENIIN